MKPKLPLISTRQAATRARRLKASEGLAYDCALAAKVAEGDTAALDRLLERHVGRVNRFLQHRLGDGYGSIIEEVTKATFDEALRGIAPYEKGSASVPMEYWLIRLAERNLQKIVRPRANVRAENRRRVRRADTEDDDLPLVRRALARIPMEDSFVVALALFEGMSAPEIAYTLGGGQAHAMKKLRSALATLDAVLPTTGSAL